MGSKLKIVYTVSALALLIGVTAVTGPSWAGAEQLTSHVSRNDGGDQETKEQPQNGKQVSYQVPIKGGDLDGCTLKAVESLFPRQDGKWGTFYIHGTIDCAADKGGFVYSSAGAWDDAGFHAAGTIKDGSGTGEFKGIRGRVAQVNTAAKSEGGHTNISYDLIVDRDN
jgi:hypothetical protein